MPAKTKIFGETEVRLRELCEKGYNALHISKEIGLARETVNTWAKKNGFLLQKGMSAKFLALEPKVVELFREGKTRKQVQKETGLHYDQVTNIAIKNGLEDLLRDRQESSLDRILSFEEATSRLPEGSGTVIDYDQVTNKYLIEASDGFLYKKSVAKLSQGDPRGKSGYSTDITKMKEQLLEIGYEFIGGFSKKRHSMKARHLKCGNVREARFRNLFLQDCPTCTNHGTSKQELSLKEWIESLGFKTSKYKFAERVTRPKEIDIDIEDTPFSIEYCGVYDHAENSRQPRGRTYHFDKMVCEAKRGKKLITIFDHEFNTRGYQIKSFLKATLGKNTQKFYAKNCRVEEIDKDLANEFLELYHIQGSGRSLICFGLFFEKALLGVVCFSKHHRDTNSSSLVLNRLCFKTDNTIIGGASKMFEFAKNKIRSLGFYSVITWSDNRWSSGDVYEQMGFALEEELGPDFYYSKGGKLYTKQSLKKTDEEKESGLSETEIRKNQGFDRVWDCGKKRWKFNLI